jgi:hypothetical protein
MTLRRKLIVLDVQYDDEDFIDSGDPETWNWQRRLDRPPEHPVLLVATGDMGEVLMPDFESLEDVGPRVLSPVCQIANCHQQAVRTIKGWDVCEAHLTDFRELLNEEE